MCTIGCACVRGPETASMGLVRVGLRIDVMYLELTLLAQTDGTGVPDFE